MREFFLKFLEKNEEEETSCSNKKFLIFIVLIFIFGAYSFNVFNSQLIAENEKLKKQVEVYEKFVKKIKE